MTRSAEIVDSALKELQQLLFVTAAAAGMARVGLQSGDKAKFAAAIQVLSSKFSRMEPELGAIRAQLDPFHAIDDTELTKEMIQ